MICHLILTPPVYFYTLFTYVHIYLGDLLVKGIVSHDQVGLKVIWLDQVSSPDAGQLFIKNPFQSLFIKKTSNSEKAQSNLVYFINLLGIGVFYLLSNLPFEFIFSYQTLSNLACRYSCNALSNCSHAIPVIIGQQMVWGCSLFPDSNWSTNCLCAIQLTFIGLRIG